MTHATITITPNSATLCTVAFDYDEATKNSVKELAGATYAGGLWTVPIMHLPALKGVFKTLDVDPVVIVAYHALLKTMLQQFGGFPPESIAITHANGIAAIYKTGWTLTAQPQPPVSRPRPQAAPTKAQRAVTVTPGEQRVWNGIQNAIKADVRDKAIVRNVWRKRKKVIDNA